MGLLTRKTDHNPYSRDIDELLNRMDEKKEEKEIAGSYEESLKRLKKESKNWEF